MSIIASLKKQKTGLTIFAGMTAMYFFSYFNRVAIPGTIFNEVQSEMGLTAAAVTNLGAIFLYVYAFAQLFIGIWADRYGGLKTLLVGSVIMCIGSILFPLSNNITMLYISRALSGFGSSFMYLCIIKETDRMFGKDFAPMLGIAYFIGFTGGLFGTLPFEMLVSATNWRAALLAIGIASAMALLLAFFTSRKALAEKLPLSKFSFAKLFALFKNKYYLYVLFCASTNYTLYFVLQTTVGKKFLEDVVKMTSKDAAAVTFVMMTGSMLTALFSGIISRMLGNRRKVFMIFATFMTMSSAFMLLAGTKFQIGGWFFLICYIILGISSGFSTIFISSARELNPPDSIGIAVGVVNSTLYVFIALSANMTGLIMDLFSSQALKTGSSVIYPAAAYSSIFLVMLLTAFVSFLISLFTKETYGYQSYEAGKNQ